MDTARALFKGKKITVLGLGLLGKGLGDTAFLAECGASLTVTDLKSTKELASSIAVLKKYKNIRYVLGKHEMSDFENCDMVIKAQGVPLDSEYIAHAEAHGIPVRMDDELFVSLAPKGVKIIGVTGTRGKTTTASLIFHILKKAGKRVYLGGNIRGVATLAFLKKVRAGDYVVLELSSWQLQGFISQKISPTVSVFTNFMPDHMNYYKNDLDRYFADKAGIFAYQKSGDTLVVGEGLVKKIPRSYKGTLAPASSALVPKSWKLPLAGEHNRENIAFAIATCRALKIPLVKIRAGVASFKAVSGRLELVKTLRGVKIYNDNNSTTPEATIAALMSFPKKQTVLIMGGADKKLPIDALLETARAYAHTVILLAGTGSDRITEADFYRASSLKEGLTSAYRSAEKGDVVLFSPGFASFGMFVNEYDRGDQFVKLVRLLK
ncbi:MAG: UDP-N-acetylmuramoyl-L-alanine--D-glutamate ligase [bacterium]